MKTELADDLAARLRAERGQGWHPFAVGAAKIASEAIEALRTPAIEDGVLREALEEIQQIAEDEAYKVTEGQQPCKHTAALNEIHEIARQALSNPTDAVKPLKEVEREALAQEFVQKLSEMNAIAGLSEQEKAGFGLAREMAVAKANDFFREFFAAIRSLKDSGR